MLEDIYIRNDIITCTTCINRNKGVLCIHCEQDKNNCFKCLQKVSSNYIHKKYPHLRREANFAYHCWEPKDKSKMPPNITLTDEDFEL